MSECDPIPLTWAPDPAEGRARTSRSHAVLAGVIGVGPEVRALPVEAVVPRLVAHGPQRNAPSGRHARSADALNHRRWANGALARNVAQNPTVFQSLPLESLPMTCVLSGLPVDVRHPGRRLGRFAAAAAVQVAAVVHGDQRRSQLSITGTSAGNPL